MTITFYCRASGRHIGLDELSDLPLSTLERWQVHKWYCPFCGDYTNELSEDRIRETSAYEYG